MNPWEKVENPSDESTLLGQQARMMRTMSMIVQVKGNPMVSVCPTTKTYYLLENSETKFHMLCRNNTRDVPYCDSFQIIEEYLFLSPEPNSQPVIKSGIFRMSFHLQWLKSTMMKSLIRGNVETETKAVFASFCDNFIKGKKNAFVEKKPLVIPSGGKKGRSLMVESSLHLQKVADRERKKA